MEKALLLIVLLKCKMGFIDDPKTPTVEDDENNNNIKNNESSDESSDGSSSDESSSENNEGKLNEGKLIDVIEGTKHASIGHDMESHTMHPEIFEDEKIP